MFVLTCGDNSDDIIGKLERNPLLISSCEGDKFIPDIGVFLYSSKASSVLVFLSFAFLNSLLTV